MELFPGNERKNLYCKRECFFYFSRSEFRFIWLELKVLVRKQKIFRILTRHKTVKTSGKIDERNFICIKTLKIVNTEVISWNNFRNWTRFCDSLQNIHEHTSSHRTNVAWLVLWFGKFYPWLPWLPCIEPRHCCFDSGAAGTACQVECRHLLRFHTSSHQFNPYCSRGFAKAWGPELGFEFYAPRNENLKLGPGVLPEARARW